MRIVEQRATNRNGQTFEMMSNAASELISDMDLAMMLRIVVIVVIVMFCFKGRAGRHGTATTVNSAQGTNR